MPDVLFCSNVLQVQFETKKFFCFNFTTYYQFCHDSQFHILLIHFETEIFSYVQYTIIQMHPFETMPILGVLLGGGSRRGQSRLLCGRLLGPLFGAPGDVLGLSERLLGASWGAPGGIWATPRALCWVQ